MHYTADHFGKGRFYGDREWVAHHHRGRWAAACPYPNKEI